ncbi:ATP-binding protein [Sphingobacterium sp. PCS056]|jgi:NadR type nicotinamide-nucleotide adenylyltransferase|uniref:AAA family ATPase n=1 Tax=Sphingobacterium TaxID=28453 RepID=UPI00200BC0E8|nr:MULTISPECIES: AAA family ATPase [unclassified Sphingobacterium]UPZ37166.1 ATP-binding protein [Sphingobacterium sp. PCS056]
MSTSNPDLIKIAVVGPESTGKSTIAQAVARHFDTVCVPEYAREYCKNLHNEYTLQDEVNMYYGQIALENTLIPLAKNNLLICDTTIMTIKIWCDYLFGDTPQDVKEEINNRHYDLYLLMDIDLPWEEDPLRDFPEHREHFMGVWESELKSLKANYIIISGLGDERLKNALEAINRK